MTLDEKLWMILRTDDGGNNFLFKKDLSKNEAEKIAEEYTIKGHKQYYTIHPYKLDELDKLLDELKVYR